MKKIIVIIVMLLPYFLLAKSTIQSIKQDFSTGEISYEEYLVNSALAIYQPEYLPLKYAQESSEMLPLKSGTFIIHEIKSNWHKLSPSSQTLLKPFLARPDLPYSVVSPSGQFRIHYATTGEYAVSIEDNNVNGIPDYVDAVIETFEYCHHFEINILGYQPPPNDRGNGGGDEYDVYIRSFSTLYGQTVPEALNDPNTYFSYMEIDNNYATHPTKGLNGLRVTAAHEYFHAIQMGYKFKSDDAFWENEIFYYEISSTWMEDVVYDEINDYYFYLTNFFKSINKPFDTYDGDYEYGNCLWNHMLTKKYGAAIIREIWEGIKNYPALESIERVLQTYGTSFNEELSEYSVWNYFTGSRQDSINYYPEAAFYPEAKFATHQLFSSDTTVTGTSSQFSFSYYHFYDTEYQTDITLVPVNIESNLNNRPAFKFELSRHGASFFKPITDEVKARMIVDNYLVWSTKAIVTKMNGENAIVDLTPIEENMLNRENPILGFGPNPFILRQHPRFKVDYQLRAESEVQITIFSENGNIIKTFELPPQQSGVNHFFWDQHKLGDFPGGSGIYLLLFETKDIKKLIKFAVIR